MRIAYQLKPIQLSSRSIDPCGSRPRPPSSGFLCHDSSLGADVISPRGPDTGEVEGR
jgi:hypothetical protein